MSVSNAIPEAAPDVALDCAAASAVDGRVGVISRMDFDVAQRILAGNISARHLWQGDVECQLLVDCHRVAQHSTQGAENEI